MQGVRRVSIPQSGNDLRSFKVWGPERGPMPQIFTLFSGVFSILNNNEAVERLKLFAICHGLPQTDMALFGIKCPYCGKSDRIRALEKPDEIKNGIIYLKGGDLTEELQNYPKATIYNISDFFSEEFFDTKKVVHLPLKFKR